MKACLVHSNTTLVKVKFCVLKLTVPHCRYSNTTLVKVKFYTLRSYWIFIGKIQIQLLLKLNLYIIIVQVEKLAYSNTTLVKVKFLSKSNL